MKKTLLHMTHGKTYSGGEHALYLLYKYIDRDRFEPVVVCLEEGLLSKRLRDLGIRVYCMDTRSKLPLRLFPRLLRLARDTRADIVINQTTRTTILGRLIALVRGLPNVTIIQAPILRDTNSTRLQWMNLIIERSTGFLSDRHIVVNRSMRREMIGWGRKPEAVRTIYNSVDPEYLDYRSKNIILKEELGIGRDNPIVGMIASFRPRKGAEYLIDAMPAVLDSVPDALLLMVGHGEWVRGRDYIEELKERARKRGVESAVIFTGFRRDIPQVISELDVLVLPSLYGEGSSLTILEAMALGRPVVASRTEGNVELIEDGVTGFLVPPADGRALSEKIRTILTDRPRATGMGEAARERVRSSFLADHMTQQYTEIFEEIIDR